VRILPRHGTGRPQPARPDNPCPSPGCSAEKNGLHILPGKQAIIRSVKRKGNGAKSVKAKKNQPSVNLYQPCPTVTAPHQAESFLIIIIGKYLYGFPIKSE